MKIAVVGSGRVGGSPAKVWVGKGHAVTLCFSRLDGLEDGSPSACRGCTVALRRA